MYNKEIYLQNKVLLGFFKFKLKKIKIEEKKTVDLISHNVGLE